MIIFLPYMESTLESATFELNTFKCATKILYL